MDNLQPLHWVGVRGELDGLPLADADPYWMQIPGDGNTYFTSLHFTMPAHDAVVYLTPFYVDPDIGDVVDEATGTVTVALAGGAPNEFSNLVAQYA